jgi:GAF domain-containing protein
MSNDKSKELIRDILNDGLCRFEAMLGIVSRIQDGTYEIYAVLSDTGIPEVGDTYPLNAVYCREVFQSRRTVAITEIDGVSGLRLHPLYDAIPCEFYISSPILIDGKVWGTYNFTSLKARTTPFSAEDIAYNEGNAIRIANAIKGATVDEGRPLLGEYRPQ